ncbi:MAG TPA: hypothetical protein VLA69_13385, partial [Gaiellaceae bacterium]|nr:hypothetical protein [Gaiellaceae bacterium]
MGTVGNLQRRVAVGVVLAASATAAIAVVLLPGGASSAPLAAAANLDQCRNGANTSPANCVVGDPNVGWVNGNAGASNSHYVEGYSIPYRATMTEIPTATPITITLGYDIKHSGKHALDYLTHFDRLEPHSPFGHGAESVVPLSGVSGVSTTVSEFDIPAPSSAGSPVVGQPTSSFNALPAAERRMTLYGGTITGISYTSQGDPNAAQAETQIAVEFTADSTTAVLAWGGHIAKSTDWGAGNSAGAISGSPYHMRLIGWSLEGLGQQDRSLQADAVFGTIEIVKNTVGGDATFGYSTTTGGGGGGLPASFDLTTSGGTASQVFAVIGGGKTYTVTESTLPANWSLEGLACNDPLNGENGTTADVATKTATIVVDASEQIACTFTNELTKLTPVVTTDVHDAQHTVITQSAIGQTVHDKATVSGSGAIPTGTVDFTVWLGNTTCSGEGTSAGTDVPLASGVADPSSSVAVPAGGLSFRAHYDGDSVYEPGDGPCEPLTALGGTIIVEKQTNPNGAPGSFSFSGDGAGSIGDGGQIVVSNLAAGTYTSSEVGVAGWTLTAITCDDANSSGSVGTRTATFNLEAGEVVKCTFFNSLDQVLGRGAIDVEKSANPTRVLEPGGPVTFSPGARLTGTSKQPLPPLSSRSPNLSSTTLVI